MYDARGGGTAMKPENQYPNSHGPSTGMKPMTPGGRPMNAHGPLATGMKPNRPAGGRPNRPFRPGRYLTPEQLFALQQMRAQIGTMNRDRRQAFQLGQMDLLNSRDTAVEDLSRGYDEGRRALPSAYTGRGLITSGIAQQGLADLDLRRSQANTRIGEQFDSGMFGLRQQRQAGIEAREALRQQIQQQIQAWITANEAQVSGG